MGGGLGDAAALEALKLLPGQLRNLGEDGGEGEDEEEVSLG